jgi:hypothetical protein
MLKGDQGGQKGTSLRVMSLSVPGQGRTMSLSVPFCPPAYASETNLKQHGFRNRDPCEIHADRYHRRLWRLRQFLRMHGSMLLPRGDAYLTNLRLCHA